MDNENDGYILQLLDESFRSSEAGNVSYDSYNFIEVFDDDSDADPDFVFSCNETSDSDIDYVEPAPSTGTGVSRKRKLITSTPKKNHVTHTKICLNNNKRVATKSQVQAKASIQMEPEQPIVDGNDVDQDNPNRSHNQPTCLNIGQTWKPVGTVFNIYPFNLEGDEVGINPDIIDTMTNLAPIDF
ncbi:hypothetical protein J6590_072474 [Homalodisca vitripennis]|nr:hypothetical protein J6590_072474 [Homalodisca vitripennis]